MGTRLTAQAWNPDGGASARQNALLQAAASVCEADAAQARAGSGMRVNSGALLTAVLENE